MYEAMFPEKGMTVMVEANQITEVYVSVSLLEYNNMNGVIFLSQVIRRFRFHDISSIVKVGYQFPANVLRVDQYLPLPTSS
jgi:translation initiation factor 2 subunit 1